MKLLVLSDNHGNYSIVKNIIQQFKDKVDYIIHCGDSEFSFDDPIWQAVDVKVAGNMDFSPGYPSSEILSTPKGKILITHGHLYQVNQGNINLLELALQKNAKYVFHGHTHRLYAEMKRGILFMNPGSIAKARGEIQEKTFSIVEISDDFIKVDYYNSHAIQLEDLSYYFKLDGAD
ncbi:metallophosphoesterase [Facklamia sp. P12955]|uniref:metallophosphoesterase n=1 Tax=Facklamia sp. P12955 TaxID=3421946 RepID=UPI003D1762B2